MSANGVSAFVVIVDGMFSTPVGYESGFGLSKEVFTTLFGVAGLTKGNGVL